MSIEEGNELIAQFLGWEIHERFHHLRGEYVLEYQNLSGFFEDYNDGYISVGHEAFHTSWDWLMPVVEKIESLGYKTGINFGHDYFTIIFKLKDNSEERTPVTSSVADTKIKSTWQACVKFIEKYNENTLSV